jgi:N-glycosylase/DNA lyase
MDKSPPPITITSFLLVKQIIKQKKHKILFTIIVVAYTLLQKSTRNYNYITTTTAFSFPNKRSGIQSIIHYQNIIMRSITSTSTSTSTTANDNQGRRRSSRLTTISTPQLMKSEDDDDHNNNIYKDFDSPGGTNTCTSTAAMTKKKRARRIILQSPQNDEEVKLENKVELSVVKPKRSRSSVVGVSNKSNKNPKAKKAKRTTKSSTKSKKTTSTSTPKDAKYVICSTDIAIISPKNKWIDLQVPPEELRPSTTLTSGQCFNFMVVHNNDNMERKNDNDGHNKVVINSKSAWGTHNETEWIGPIHDMVISIKETHNTTLFRIVHESSNNHELQGIQNITKFIKDLFQLETKLKPLYNDWSNSDIRLGKIAKCIPGVRIIRQDPIECLFSFICSSNNNIPRITKMLSSFRKTYGRKLLDIPMRLIDSSGGTKLIKCDEVMTIHSFPTLQQLQHATEEELRGMGLGYRAKYIIQTRDLLIKNGGRDHLLSLRSISDHEKVQEELLQYAGIGRKVADCIALFSLDQKDAIPVDVHVQHIASRDYDPSVLGTAKSLTPTIYKQVGELFRDRFDYAGWAHSLLFVAELPSFRDVLPEDVVAEMDVVSI